MQSSHPQLAIVHPVQWEHHQVMHLVLQAVQLFTTIRPPPCGQWVVHTAAISLHGNLPSSCLVCRTPSRDWRQPHTTATAHHVPPVLNTLYAQCPAGFGSTHHVPHCSAPWPFLYELACIFVNAFSTGVWSWFDLAETCNCRRTLHTRSIAVQAGW